LTTQRKNQQQKGILYAPNYLGYFIGPVVLGAVLVYIEPVTIPLVFLIFILAYKYGMKGHNKRIAYFSDYMNKVVNNLESTNHHIVAHMQVGLAVFGNHARLQWYNEKFKKIVSKEQISGMVLESLLPLQSNAFDELTAKESGRRIIFIGEKIYSMEHRRLTKTQQTPTGIVNSLEGLAIYLYDNTKFVELQKKYANEKLALCSIRFDNYEEVCRSMSDSGIIALNGAVSGMLTKWVSQNNGFIVNMSNELSLVGFTHKDLGTVIKSKFSILDDIHGINAGGRMSPTLSIGIATIADSLNELLDKSQEALDLALNRGGDQAVVDNDGHLSYFGATGAVVAKATRVRARIMAQALREYMEKAENIIVMGHTKEDFDSIGSCVGIATMAKFLEKPVNIAVGSLSGEIIRSRKSWSSAGINNDFEKLTVVGKDNCLELVTPNTLLILVDHHRQQISSIPELVDAVTTKIVIDHHRRSEDIIPNLPLLYQEPSSSSTSELITELFAYFDEDIELTSMEATCLYNGILLDTKKFTVQTSERTFEAAALLRRSGANLTISNDLFANNLHDLQQKSLLLSTVTTPLKDFAIIINENKDRDPRATVLAAQTSDELICSLGVHGAAVLTQYDDVIHISARSDGSIYNVQVIMEALGGGGHQLSAACQIKNKTMSEVKTLLLEEIKKQLED